jgi:hypothetical protein
LLLRNERSLITDFRKSQISSWVRSFTNILCEEQEELVDEEELQQPPPPVGTSMNLQLFQNQVGNSCSMAQAV